MNTKRHLRPVLGAFLILGALAAAAAAPAQSQSITQTPCATWDLNQDGIAVKQGDYAVYFSLRQKNTHLTGTAQFKLIQVRGTLVQYVHEGETVRGSVNGSIRGNAVELETSWGGVYIGTIDSTGRIDGYSYDMRDSTSSASWYSKSRLHCTKRAGDPEPGAVSSTVNTKPATIKPLRVPNHATSMLTQGRGSRSSTALTGTLRPLPMAPAEQPTLVVPAPMQSTLTPAMPFLPSRRAQCAICAR